jgi:hypothetical protein
MSHRGPDSTAEASAVWAPEIRAFPAWAAGTDLMSADAAGWNRAIRDCQGEQSGRLLRSCRLRVSGSGTS